MTDQNPTPPPQPAAPQTVVNVNMANTNQARAAAVAAAPPQAPRAPVSAATAYVLFALGAGVLLLHRLYLDRPRKFWLFLFFFCALGATPIFLFGGELAGAALAYGAAPWLLLLAADLVRIPRWVREYNSLLEPPLGGTVAGERTGFPAVEAQASPLSPSVNSDLKTRLLRAAHRGGGTLTVTQAVMETAESFEAIEACLGDMVQAGYVDVDNQPESGVIVYVFPELVGRPIHRDPQPRQEIAE